MLVDLTLRKPGSSNCGSFRSVNERFSVGFSEAAGVFVVVLSSTLSPLDCVMLHDATSMSSKPKVKLKRMHSSRMRTARAMIGRISWGEGAYHTHPPFRHACPPSPRTPPLLPRTPPLHHTPPRHACPPGPTMHAPPGATTHAPQNNHACPPREQPRMPPREQPHMPPLWTE